MDLENEVSIKRGSDHLDGHVTAACPARSHKPHCHVKRTSCVSPGLPMGKTCSAGSRASLEAFSTLAFRVSRAFWTLPASKMLKLLLSGVACRHKAGC